MRHSGYFEAQSRLCEFALLFSLHVFHCKLSSELTRCPPQKKYCARKKASGRATYQECLSNVDNHSRSRGSSRRSQHGHMQRGRRLDSLGSTRPHDSNIYSDAWCLSGGTNPLFGGQWTPPLRSLPSGWMAEVNSTSNGSTVHLLMTATTTTTTTMRATSQSSLVMCCGRLVMAHRVLEREANPSLHRWSADAQVCHMVVANAKYTTREVVSNAITRESSGCMICANVAGPV